MKNTKNSASKNFGRQIFDEKGEVDKQGKSIEW